MSEAVISGEALPGIEKRLQSSGKKKIVVVGGSHSAFSAAWYDLLRLTLTRALIASPRRVCLRHLVCFQEQPSEEAKGDKVFIPAEQHSICLLHRSPIQVFYATKREADLDKYTDIGEVTLVCTLHAAYVHISALLTICIAALEGE